jgi:hypothetical protein
VDEYCRIAVDAGFTIKDVLVRRDLNITKITSTRVVILYIISFQGHRNAHIRYNSCYDLMMEATHKRRRLSPPKHSGRRRR